MFKNKKGFTLIELLVVIAIIGVLASVVLASLNTARDKGNDAAIKANLANIRAQAELFYTDNGNDYNIETNACSTLLSLFIDPVIGNALTAAASASSDTSATCISSDGTGADTTSGGQASTWAISIALSDGTDWCVNSTGAAEGGSASITGTGNPATCS